MIISRTDCYIQSSTLSRLIIDRYVIYAPAIYVQCRFLIVVKNMSLAHERRYQWKIYLRPGTAINFFITDEVKFLEDVLNAIFIRGSTDTVGNFAGMSYKSTLKSRTNNSRAIAAI